MRASMIHSMRGSAVLLVTLCTLGCEKKHQDEDQALAPAASTRPVPAITSALTRTPSSIASASEPTTQASTTKAEAKDALKEADDDMREVLEQLAALGGKPIPTLTPVEARKQPTPADAVKKLLEAKGKSTEPLVMAKVEDRKIPGAAGRIDARIYTPKTDAGKALPMIAYWHGGGFVIADLNVYDATPRALADLTGAIVVSLDYRRAPEAKFPAAHEDAFAGYEWVLKNATSLGGDPKRIAVAGESVGGNLAANVAIMARDKQLQLPVHQLLVYPVTQSNMDTPSYDTWAQAKPLDKPMMTWFVEQYTTKPSDAQDPRIALVNANLTGLPPTTIVNAEIDPLLSDGELFETKLDAAGVDVTQKTYSGVTHEFFGMAAVVGDAKDAQEWAADRLKESFEK